MSGTFHGRGGPPRSACYTKSLVLARVRADDQTLSCGYGKVQSGIPDPLSERGATTPWTYPGYTRRPGQGEQQYPIGGRGRGSGATPTPTQGWRTHPPSHGALQVMVTGGISQGTVEEPPAEGAMDVHGRPSTEHVAHGGYPSIWYGQYWS